MPEPLPWCVIVVDSAWQEQWRLWDTPLPVAFGARFVVMEPRILRNKSVIKKKNRNFVVAGQGGCVCRALRYAAVKSRQCIPVAGPAHDGVGLTYVY